MKKTNAMRILESMNISYDVVSYNWDEEHLDAIHASEAAGLSPSLVYKTIVMQDSSKQIFVFCIPALSTVNIKKVRTLTESKDLQLLKMNQLQQVTGYIRGGCSPLGMKKHFPTFIDELAQLEPCIYVSAGQRGMQIKINSEDLVLASGAQYADIC
ncbi:MAG: Cys-tRNA(Pro) deacylase [Spirochaetia bacterium]|nr:Cys-tRNA(Pro) deacylase [Spirochaetia bacterium]